MTSGTIDAVVAGHICLDLTPQFGSGGGLGAMKPGSLTIVGPSVISTGGIVANTGLALRRLGVSAVLMGKCSGDHLGRILLDLIRKEAPGAERGMRIAAGETTSYSVVVSPPGTDRLFLHCPGANDTFSATDINYDLVEKSRLFHFGYPPLMLRMCERSGAELAEVFRRVRQGGATTSLDMAMPDPESAAGRSDWPAILERVLPLTDLFVPSVEELLFMLNRPRFDALRAKPGAILNHVVAEDVHALGDACVRLGAGIVLIKCGRFGVYLRTAGGARLKQFGRARPAPVERWADRALWHPVFSLAKIVNTTGAGDTAIAGFLTAFLNGLEPETALRCCIAVGHQNVQARDALSGIGTWAETLDMVGQRLPLDAPMAGVESGGWRCDAHGIYSRARE